MISSSFVESFATQANDRRSISPSEMILNDVHSRLNATRVARIVQADSSDAIAAALRHAREEGLPVSISGGGHAMGGQQFRTGGLHLDTRGLDRILSFDPERGIVEVEAGIQWPALVAGLCELQVGELRPWSIIQKQTGADRLAIGGALSANAHGRGLRLPPIVGDIESFTLIGADGRRRRASRAENTELFRLAIGGYGLFGVIDTVRLRLQRRQILQRVVEVRHVEGLDEAFAARIAEGHLYGDFQFEVDERSPNFLTRGVFATYRPIAAKAEAPSPKELAAEDWLRLLRLAHVDKSRAFDEYAAHYLGTDGQRYASDLSQLSYYPEGYHAELDRHAGSTKPASEMITEVYVPRGRIAELLTAAATELRRVGANVVYGTVRLIERDRETFLPWARQDYACAVFNLHLEHDDEGISRAKDAFRLLIDLAQERGGSYFLTYHRWATAEQLRKSYPELPEVLAAKQQFDPEGRFQSDWLEATKAALKAAPLRNC